MAGEYPIKSDEESARRRIEKYLDCGITYFVDLTNIGEKPQYESILKTVATSKGLEVGDTLDCQSKTLVSHLKRK